MCRFDDLPFSGGSAAPETHPTPSVSSYILSFPFFEKFSIFRPISLQFGQNFSSKLNTLILAKIIFQDPSF